MTRYASDTVLDDIENLRATDADELLRVSVIAHDNDLNCPAYSLK